MTLSPPREVEELIDTLNRAGHAAYAVGGCVRDGLIGRAPKDWDLATDALPEEIKACLIAFRVLDTGIRHGTVTALCAAGPVEITTFRRDGRYLDHRRPEEVRFVRSLKEDLARRDFTVNAMAYCPKEGLIDPFGGRADLADGLLRCVGEAGERFSEDALRILRALRFSAELGFRIEKDTALAARRQRGELRFVSAERRFQELSRLLPGEAAERALTEYPEIVASALNLDAVAGARGIGALPPDAAIRFAFLLRGADAERVLRGLRADKRTIERAKCLRALAARSLPRSEKEARALLFEAGEGEKALDACRLIAAEAGKSPAGALGLIGSLLENGVCYRLKDLQADGAALKKIGLPEGKPMGDALKYLLKEVAQGNLPNEEEALSRAALARFSSISFPAPRP